MSVEWDMKETLVSPRGSNGDLTSKDLSDMVRGVMEILWNSEQDHRELIKVCLAPLAMEGEIALSLSVISAVLLGMSAMSAICYRISLAI